MSNPTRTVLIEQRRYAPSPEGPWGEARITRTTNSRPSPWCTPYETWDAAPGDPERYGQFRVIEVALPPDDEPDAEYVLAVQALGDAIERPHGGRLGEAVQAIARFVLNELNKPGR